MAIKKNTLPLVVVNGAQQTIASWRSLISQFEDRYQIILFDLPGQGGSKVLTGEDHIKLQEQSDVLSSVINATAKDSTINIITSSWGGAVAANYTANNPDRVNKLILGSFGLSANRNMESVINLGQAAIERGDYDALGQIIVDGFGGGLTPMLQQKIIKQFQLMSKENIAQFYEHISWSLDTNLLDEIDFSNIKASTLLINGSSDTVVDVDALKPLETLIPNCVRRVIKDVGHFLHFENKEIINDYDEFLIGT